jgi:hypothetical protein
MKESSLQRPLRNEAVGAELLPVLQKIPSEPVYQE